MRSPAKSSLCIAKEGNASGNPMIGFKNCFEHEGENIGGIGSVWLLVNRSFVEGRGFLFLHVGGKHVDNREAGVQDFGGGFD